MNRLLTVLMPTLNAARYLAQSLDSLAAQTFRDFDLLVIDAESTDDTLGVLRNARMQTTVISSGPIGLGAQLRLGLDRIRSKYVARMDADDVSDPARFVAQIRALENHPELSIVGSQICLLVGNKLCRAGELPQRHETIRTALLEGFPAFSHPTVMFRTEAARRCKAYSISGPGEDLDFYLRMTEVGKGKNLSTILHRYRIHEHSVSFTTADEVQRNYRYAVACARARDRGTTEPGPEEYSSAWNKRSQRAQLLGRLEGLGARLYRTSRIRFAEGRQVRGLIGAVVSLLLRPRLIRVRALIRWGAWRHAMKCT